MSPGFLPYQIEFNAIAAGKRVSSTKRKIRWRFGYANEQAMSDGLTGTDCRGEEHDVTIVWSITSGKRQISMDGKEIHYSTNRASLLDFSWQAKGNHVIKLTCHAAPPMTAQPGFRQYDLSIDGQSFFTMPKVFQLGVRGAVGNTVQGGYRTANTNFPSPVAATRSSSLSNAAPRTREQEELDLRSAIEASINESRHHLGETSNGYRNSNNQVDDLLGFGAPAPHPAANVLPPADARSVASYYSAPTTYGQAFQSPAPPVYNPSAAPPSNFSQAIVPAVAPSGYYQAPPSAAPGPPTYASPAPPSYASPAPPSYAASPAPPSYANPAHIAPAYASPPPPPPAPHSTPSVDVFGLHSALVQDPFAPRAPLPVTQQDMTNAILASYQSPGSAAPQTPMANNAGAASSLATPGTPHANGTNGGVTLSMNQLSLTSTNEKPKSEFEKALSNLVNVDHIDEPAEAGVKLTMMKREEAKKVVKGKSVPKPPVGMGMAGSNAPLSQIRQDYRAPGNNSTEGIMNQPPPGAFNPNAIHAGALVVHGQGPPPLQQASGFGVGRVLPNGGFSNQQNLTPGQYMQQQKMY